jgi:hypothetical protein
LVALEPEHVGSCRGSRNQNLHDSLNQNQPVDNLFKGRFLGLANAQITHNSRVFASIRDESDHKLRILEFATTQQEVVIVQRKDSAVRAGHQTRKLVNFVVGRVALNRANCKVMEVIAKRLLLFEIGLAINILCFHIAEALRRRLQEHNVSWDTLTILDSEDVALFDGSPFNKFPIISGRAAQPSPFDNVAVFLLVGLLAGLVL